VKASKYSKATMTHQVLSMISWLVWSPNSRDGIFIRGEDCDNPKFFGIFNGLISFLKKKNVGLS
jgi:hypothetical protein